MLKCFLNDGGAPDSPKNRPHIYICLLFLVVAICFCFGVYLSQAMGLLRPSPICFRSRRVLR